MSHTRSLSGNDAAASAFIERLGMCRVRGIGEFVETLKVLNLKRKVTGTRTFSMSCSGGEAALVSVRDVLGQDIALANPLDYHTVIWDDKPAMQKMVAGMLQANASGAGLVNDGAESTLADIALLVLDFPRLDRCEAPSWQRALDAFVSVVRPWAGVGAVIASLPENMPESISKSLAEQDTMLLGWNLRHYASKLSRFGWTIAAVIHLWAVLLCH